MRSAVSCLHGAALMTRACHFVLLALLPGCYVHHGRDGRPVSSPVADGGLPSARGAARPRIPRPDAGLPPDAEPPPRLDAGASPPLMCPLQRANLTCLESFLIPPGRAFSLPYAFDGCGCCTESECRVSVDAATRTLAIETTLCPDHCDCDACYVPTGSCEVPALQAGDWRVLANGAEAFVLPVYEDSGEVPPPPACATYAGIDACGGAPALPGRAIEEPACVQWVGLGEIEPAVVFHAVRVQHRCWGCGDLHGACVARLEPPHFSDDHTWGGEIHLDPAMFSTSCDIDCPGVCIESSRDCAVPPLVRGQRYSVHLDGRRVATFTAGEPTTACP